jgi:inosine-uridine nucleoside N-ribohydrolase
MSGKPRLILDFDPGNDDALALAAALVFADLAGVTTVYGNGDVDACLANAQVAANVCGYAGPILRGAPRPLINDRPPASPAQPFSTLASARAWEFSLGANAAPAANASTFLEDAADSATWIVATAPLTNLALALRRDPALAPRIQGISIMGGSMRGGNVTPVAEFNIWSDPEAARIVLTSGASLRLCGLHVTHRVLADKKLVEDIRQLRARSSPFLAELLDIYIDTYPDAFVGEHRAPLHDPCAVLAVTHPHLFEWRNFPVDVELTGALTRGMTVVDERSHPSNAERQPSRHPPDVSVAVDCDSRAILDKMVEAAASLR